MDVFDLVAKLTLDSSEYETGLGKAKTFAGGALKTAAKVGAAALAAATAAVVGFGASSVKTGAEFDKSMSQVAATMGTTTDEISNLREFALQMGSTTAFSATQAADALNYMALAGYDANKSMEMLPNVLNLAAAGNIDLARASDMVTDAQSALGLTMDDTTTMVDQMAKTSSKSNTSVEQLGEAILTIGATARSVSGGTAELNTVLGILADNGIKGAEGGTHLRNAILSLQTPTKDGEAALAKLNMTYEDMYDSAGNLRSMPEIFQQMSTAMDGMTQQSKDAIISGIFNKTDLAAVNALLGTTGERWEELETAIGDANGAAEQMAATQLDNLAGDVTLFKSALEGAKIAVSDQLTPSLREMVQYGTDAITTLSTAFKEGGLDGAMDALGKILSDGVSMIVKGLPKFVSAGAKLLKSIGKGIVENLPTLLDAGGEIIAMLVEGLGTGIPAFMDAITTIIETLVEKIGDPASLQGMIEGGIKIVVAIAQGLINAAPRILVAMATLLMNLFIAVSNTVGKFIQQGAKIVANLISGLASKAGAFLAQVVSLIADAISTIAGKLGEFLSKGKEIVSKLISGIGQKIAEAKAKAREVINGVKSAIEEKVGEFTSIGSNIISGLINGMTGMLGSVIEKAKGIIRSIKEAMTGEAEIESPSKLFAREVGKWIPAGVAEGMDRNLGAVEKSARNIIDVTESMFDTVEANKVKVHDALGEVVDFAPFINTAKSAQENAGFIQQNTINIYTQKGQSEQEIAAQVQRVLVRWDKQRKAAGVA